MVYTIGHEASYEQYFKEQAPEVPEKLGRVEKENYLGGAVWNTREQAQQNCPVGYKVYGVEADWKTDTAEPEAPDGSGMRHLLKTSPLVRLD